MNRLPLDGRSEEQKIQEAIELLRDRGYTIIEPIGEVSFVKTTPQLVKFFYATLHKYKPNCQYAYSKSSKRDLAIAKSFIDSRVSAGSSRHRAIHECCGIIEALFKYESRLNLNFEVTSFSALGQDKMSWITEKIVTILNNLDREVNAAVNEEWYSQLYQAQESTVPEEQVEKAKKRLNIEK